METDRTECNDLSTKYPDVVQELGRLYQGWRERCLVEPWREVLELRQQKRSKG